ncbi:MAG: phospho-N-acetylmuramoyl-pentapeptide-transferase [Candidatus Pacebacteria bacterium]|nr:phospho-N-acetylmuramoyl-pentapeptide-transferase [Candidatus Paceibacterota bacterium]
MHIELFSQISTLHPIVPQAIRVTVLTAVAFIVAMALTPLWVKLLKKYRFGKQLRTGTDTPVFQSLHKNKEGILTGAGIIIWSTVLGLAVIFDILNHAFDGMWHYFNFIDRGETYLPLAAMLISALLGLLDDWLGVLRIGGAKGGGLQVRHKSFLYLIAAAIGAWWFFFRLGWNTLAIPFVGNVVIGWWYIPVFIFIIFASAFSANETDGLDGLLGGVSLFAFFALTTVAFVLHLYNLAAFGGVVIGALLAFLWNNIYPAKFIMGDTGSMALGVTIGTISMLTNTTLLLPFFAIILVIESVSVIIQLISKKLRHGKKIFRSTPIHHHFEALGWPESQVTMRAWIVSAMFCALGLVVFFLSR